MTYAMLMQLKPHICMTYAVHMPAYALRRRRLGDHAGKGSEDSFGAVGRDECRGSIPQAARRSHHQKRQERLRGMVLTPEAADVSERNVQLESERLRTLSVSASRQGLSVIGPSVQGDRKKKPDGDSVPVVVHWEEVPLRASCLAWRAAFFSFLFSSLSCFLDVSAIAVTSGVCVGEVRKPIPSA